MTEQSASHVAWVVNCGGHDYSKALNRPDVHEIQYLTSSYVNFAYLDRVTRMLLEAVSFTSSEDYIVVAGSGLLNLIVGAIWMHKHGKLKVLAWDPKTSDYRALTITDPQLTTLTDLLLTGAASSDDE